MATSIREFLKKWQPTNCIAEGQGFRCCVRPLVMQFTERNLEFENKFEGYSSTRNRCWMAPKCWI